MQNKVSVSVTSLLVFGALLTPAATVAENELNPWDRDSHADGRGNYSRFHGPRAATAAAAVTGNGINYHNGSVIRGNVNIYYIWYGNWASTLSGTNASAILTNFASGIGSSPYFAINTTYGDTTGNVSGNVAYAGSTSDSGSLGTALSDSNIRSLVLSALSSGRLPTDTNGVYFVLTAPGVAETSGFLTHYCGWHTYGILNGAYIKYSFVGDAAGPSLGACAAQAAHSPNGNPGVDAMVSVVAHELEESVTDPNLNAWYDSSGEENADKCAWTFGAVYAATGGGAANMKLGPGIT
jgi:hypothetical protein